ncbi:protein translocase subunit SecD [Vibrio splendidus]|uniref:Protein translocase subunit SecD n=1 Tax=Vibrio splendidus TaxID=29497 RepID=A0ABD5A779_VIBSP|nr:protein translocase subunit SecD [Vibrio splendidus]MBT9243640.1 protein translocase subunit SecD [Vibrio splendidus]MDH5893732.1 protein translocase subunit SecD [Vibrio splendidus]MDP2489025.1 protein translocase subunit SecD [Vibrio splendidus]MDP2614867.1 protein translocase subunit SecD [Vibrio splendidus]PTO59639.1 protein translocase subunit SecD [Vibrio splendidus]
MTVKKRIPRKQINHYSKWKYAVLIATIIIMVLSALPSWYGENASVQISNRSEQTIDATQITQYLASEGIQAKSAFQKDKRLVVILEDAEQQAKAKEVLNERLLDNATVALAMEPAAPKWLTDMGFAPIQLGLDLRGGVQFLLEVDMEPVYHAQAQAMVDEVTSQVRYARGKVVNNQVQFDFRTDADFEKAQKLIRQEFPQWLRNRSDKSLTLTQSEEEQRTLRNLTVQQNLQIMRSRIEELGITEASIQRQGESRIRIELPGVQDPAAAKDVIGATASLAFYSVYDNATRSTQTLKDSDGNRVVVDRKAVLSGEHIIDARSGIGEMGSAEVNITLDSSGGKKMSEFSRHNIGKPMATVYSEYSRDRAGNSKQDSEVISVANIQSQLGSRFRITGAGSLADAQELALLLRAGSLTAPVTIIEERTIGPSLGAENVTNGFAALALGLGLTLTFMALWYRRLGWVANCALVVNMTTLFGLIALLPGAVLTLPGIAGLVLTVGMAVDTNVLIFERIRDKMKEGRSFASSIDRGFDSAFSSIFDANVTTMIVAVALYTIGNGPIQGFALTLGLGLLTSMFTGIFASRAIINLVWGRDQRHDVRI